MSAVKDLDPLKVADKVQPDLEECDGPKLGGNSEEKKRDDLGRLQFSLGKTEIGRKSAPLIPQTDIHIHIWISSLKSIKK